MTRQTTAPLQRVPMSSSKESIVQLLRQWRDGSLDVNPPYQRGDVWTLDQRVNLIRSLLRGTAIPAIITNQRPDGDVLRAVVDGKQRLTTLRMWFDGELAVPASWFPAEMVVTAIDLEAEGLADEYGDTGPYVFFTGLTGIGQGATTRIAVPVVEAQAPTVADEAEIYLLVNGMGTAQTAEDMSRAARIADLDA